MGGMLRDAIPGSIIPHRDIPWPVDTVDASVAGVVGEPFLSAAGGLT